MYCLVRKNNQYRVVKSDLAIGSDTLVKSIFSPKWYGSTWQLLSITEKKTWMTFLKKGRINDPRFNYQIEQSWRRCQLAEVHPIKGVCEKFIPAKELEHRSEKLTVLAKPIIDTLYHCVKGS